MAQSEKIMVEMTRQEALVLFEYLRRCDDENGYSFRDQAEQRVLWMLEGAIESKLPEIFDPQYGALLQMAWEKLRDPE